METTPESSFEEVWAAGSRWQTALRRRWRYLPDLDAELRAAVWEGYISGLTDQRALYEAASVAARRVSRREIRHQRLRTSARVDRFEDPFEDLIQQLDAERTIRSLDIPVQARAWVSVMTDDSRASRSDMIAGRRWANRARAELHGGADHAA